MLPQNQMNITPASSSPDEEAVETIEVSDDEVIEVEDATGDVNVAAKLPPAGIYPVRWSKPKEDSVYKSKTKSEPHRAFVATQLLGAVQADGEDYHESPVYVNHINSLQRRGKTTSDLHHFMNIIGAPIPNRSTTGEIEQHVNAALDDKPVGMAELDWRAAYKDAEGNWQDYKTKMTDFPKEYLDANGELADAKTGKWSGRYLQSVASPLNGEELNAQLYVRKHLSQQEAQKAKAAKK